MTLGKPAKSIIVFATKVRYDQKSGGCRRGIEFEPSGRGRSVSTLPSRYTMGVNMAYSSDDWVSRTLYSNLVANRLRCSSSICRQ